MAVAAVDQQVFPAPAHGEDGASGQELDIRGDRPAQPRLAHFDARDDATGELRGEAATRDFDFGQLWHCATGRLVRGTKYT